MNKLNTTLQTAAVTNIAVATTIFVAAVMKKQDAALSQAAKPKKVITKFDVLISQNQGAQPQIKEINYPVIMQLTKLLDSDMVGALKNESVSSDDTVHKIIGTPGKRIFAISDSEQPNEYVAAMIKDEMPSSKDKSVFVVTKNIAQYGYSAQEIEQLLKTMNSWLEQQKM